MQIRNVRFIIAAITTFGAYAVYVSRVNLSIAIIAMVDDHHGDSLKSNTQTIKESNLTKPMTISSNINSSSSLPLAEHHHEWPPSDKNSHHEFDENNATISLASSPNLGANSIFPTSKKSIRLPIISQEKFHWDQTEQGHILGAFFYGYILFQIPGARIAESVGAKWILFTGIFSSAVISLVFPLSTQLNSLHLLMLLRFIMGLSQSAFFPAAYVLFCRWLPERERSILLPIMFIGSNVGSISTYILSSYLISSSYGWPSVFYLSGLICLIVSLLWYLFVSSEPENNWLITDDECRFIKKNVSNQSSEINSLNDDDDEENNLNVNNLNDRTPSTSSIDSFDSKDLYRKEFNNRNKLSHSFVEFLNEEEKEKTATIRRNSISKGKRISEKPLLSLSNDNNKRNFNQQQQQQQQQIIQKKDLKNDNLISTQPSWNKILTSIPIWTLVFSMYGNEWSNVVLCYVLPTYLNTALNFPIEQNGVINSFFQLSFAVASPIMSSLGAYALDKHLLGMRKIHVRKLFQSLATFGQLLCFISVPICGSNKGLIIMFMFAAVVFKSCANAGDIMVSGDLSPEYAGTLFAFANSVGNTAGVFVPELAGAIVKNPYDREHWTPFWLTTAAIMGFSGLIFLIFGVTRRQEFGPDSDDQIVDKTKIKLDDFVDIGNFKSANNNLIELPSHHPISIDCNKKNINEQSIDLNNNINIKLPFTAKHSHLS